MTAQAQSTTTTAAGFRTPGLGATIASEWTKLTSVRSTWIVLLLTFVLGFGAAALVSLAIGSTYDDWTAQDQASFDPVMTGFIGSIFSAILLGVLGVNAVATEYSSGQIRLTLAATPRRGRVLAAKIIVISVITLVVGTIVGAGTFLVAQAIFSSYGMPSTGIGDSEALRAVLGVGLGGPIYPLIGMALAVLLRSTAGAITTLMAIIFAPSMFAPLFPDWWQENILRYLPANAADNLAGVYGEDSLAYLDLVPAIALVAAWLVVFLGAAYVVLARRDA